MKQELKDAVEGFLQNKAEGKNSMIEFGFSVGADEVRIMVSIRYIKDRKAIWSDGWMVEFDKKGYVELLDELKPMKKFITKEQIKESVSSFFWHNPGYKFLLERFPWLKMYYWN